MSQLSEHVTMDESLQTQLLNLQKLLHLPTDKNKISQSKPGVEELIELCNLIHELIHNNYRTLDRMSIDKYQPLANGVEYQLAISIINDYVMCLSVAILILMLILSLNLQKKQDV